jgi:cobalamin biosynthesis protein CobT
MKMTGQSEEVHATLAQEEQNSDAGEEQVASSPPTPDEQPEQTTTEEDSSSSPASEAAEADNTEAAEVSEEDASPRKKRKKKAEPVDVQQISPRPSYWPIALAFSLIVAFVGLADSPIVLGIGVLMIITSVIGWGLERR